MANKHHIPPSAPPSAPPQSPPPSSLTSTAATATTEAANAGVEQRVGNKKKLKMKHLDQPTVAAAAAAATTPTGSATTCARQWSFTCLSETRPESPVTPLMSMTARETGSLSDTCLSATTLELPVISPLPSTSTITITKPEPVKTGKRKRSPTPTSTKTSRHYTNGRVINREMFSTQVEKVLAGAASSLGPIHNQDERTRREELAAYFLDWHLDRAVEFAVNDLKRKFRQ